MIWLIFGAPGSGKGTQSGLLVENQGFKHLSTGDMFRYHLKNKTEIGLKAQNYLDKGELVPDDVVTEMVQAELKAKKPEDNLILDGYPRTMKQAKSLSDMTETMDIPVKGALFLSVPDDLLIKRLSGRRMCSNCGEVYHVEYKAPAKEGVCDLCGGDVVQRKDDQSDVIKNRLEVYRSNTEPLIDYYKNKGQFLEIDGVGSTDDVQNRISNVLD